MSDKQSLSQRLLIVDDDVQICDLLKNLGESCNYAVSAIHNLGLLEKHFALFNPTIIIVDLNLTDNDGIEILRFLAEKKSKAPIIILSGCEDRVRASSFRLGQSYGLNMKAHLAKPVELKKIRSLLEEVSQNDVLAVTQRLSKAIESFELVLHFQPKISMETNQLEGVEALVRWKPNNKELILPDAFISLAEQTGLIEPLTFWVIENAFLQEKNWSDDNLNFSIAINLSPTLLGDLLLPERIDSMAKKLNIEPKRICFEITETAVFTKPEVAMDILTRLGIKGFKISVDDFGTGYSSLVQLHKMPFEEIKIDKSFVLNSKEDPDAWVIIKAIVDLGHNLHLTVVAEGVEDNDTLDSLKNINCDIAQGFYISRPISALDFNKWIQSNLNKNLTLKK